MKITDSYSPYLINDMGTVSRKPSTVKDYSNYLTRKYGCLTPGKNASVSVTGGLLQKAMSDEKTGAWLEKELSKAPDYIRAAQQSAIAHGSTLKFVSIEFGEEYSTMTTCTVTDGGGTEPEIDKWLENIKEKRAKQREGNKKVEHKQETPMIEAESYTSEFRGKGLDDLTEQFVMKMSGETAYISGGIFDMRG